MFEVLIDQFWSLTIAGVALGFIYVLVSLGYTMVYGVLRMINFANSEIFMWGTFGTIIASRDIFGYTQTSAPATGPKLALVLISQLLMSMAVAGLTAVFVEYVAYRRLRAKGTNRLATLISAIGISIVLSELMRLLTDSRPVGSPRVLEKIILGEVWGANLRLDTIVTIFAAAGIYFLLERFVKLSRMGKAIRAVSMNEDAAKLMGVNLNRVITTTFLVGGLATGAAAFSQYLNTLNLILVSQWVWQHLPQLYLVESATLEALSTVGYSLACLRFMPPPSLVRNGKQ